MRTWYYARNGRRFGPVGLEEVKSLLATGSLDAEDMVWRDGMEEWLRVDEVEELAEKPAPAVVMPPPLPPAEYVAAQAEGEEPAEIEPGSEPLSVGRCVAYTMKTIAEHRRLMITCGLIFLIGVAGCFEAGHQIDLLRNYKPPVVNWFPMLPEANEGITQALAVSWQVTLAANLIDCFLTAGLARVAMKLVRGENTSAWDIFQDPVTFLKLLCAEVLYTLAVVVGMLFMLAPAFYLAAVFSQYRFAILERKMGVIEAFIHSAKITQGSILPLISLVITMFFLTQFGMMTYVGLIFVMPFITLLQACIYRALTRGGKALPFP